MPETSYVSNPDSVPAIGPARPSLPGRLLRGPATDPAWYRPALLVLLLCTAVLYLWNLSASGYANSFYAAAVQAGTESWKAFFFGSLDASSFITVDKPPASLWVMELSGRAFGFSSWSMLVPEALEGVAAVALLAATVRRAVRPVTSQAQGAAAGLIAGAVMALTPAAVLIFRFNNPDGFLVLLLVSAAYCLTRALEHASTRWLIAAGVTMGFGFLTKSGEALLPLPAFALAYLVAGPASLWRRVWQLLAAGVALVVAAGWWVTAVLLTPAANRPYIGGSTDNNPLQLAFGYNGLDRLVGNSGGGDAPGGAGLGAGGGIGAGGGAGLGGAGRPGGGAAGGSFGGTAGIQRLFGDEFGREISWLLPAAAILLIAGVWLTWRHKRTDQARAGLIIWGGWLLIVGVTFAYMQGTIHPYYTVALAPAIGALVGTGGVLAWHRARQPRVHRDRSGAVAYAFLALAVAVTIGWDVTLWRDNTAFHGSLAYVALVLGVAAIAALAVLAWRSRTGRRLVAVTATLTGLALIGPATAWAVGTAATPHTGSIPTAVSVTGSGGGPGGGGGGFGGGTFPGGAGFRDGTGGAGRTGAGAGGGGIGAGNPGGGTTASSALIKALRATTTRWAAAVGGSQDAASLELASGGKSVMAMGGFTGSDPAPTLAEFGAWVKAGDITYYIAGGGGSSSQITSWVQAHYPSETIGGETVYLLLEPR